MLSSEGYKANQSWQAYEDISTGSEPTDKKMHLFILQSKIE
ncbi:hypothetical protein SDC9_89576 [bioreactor metagenome]|uniref:Uncharacterized protein n=1 Tax=bioreactor metagenome TaxID=1076179 RepID=A0A644ZZB5_9ZZZZ